MAYGYGCGCGCDCVRILMCTQGGPEPFWPEITLKTQRVVDAVQKSWQQDGAKIMIEPFTSPKL
jgi:hypothetical protein